MSRQGCLECYPVAAHYCLTLCELSKIAFQVCIMSKHNIVAQHVINAVCDVCCLVPHMLHSAAQGQEDPQDAGVRNLAVEGTWAGTAQQAPPPPPPSPAHRLGSPKRQTISGETSRGRSPEPDPTGTEDSPLSQVPPSTCSPPFAPTLWEQFRIRAGNILGQDLLGSQCILA